MNLTQKEIDRFWSHVDIRGENECWNWKAAKVNGYGYFRVSRILKRNYYAHVVAWSIEHKRMPRKGYHIAHAPIICHNRACCNQNHLKEKTAKENEADKILDGVTNHGEHHGSHTHPERVARGDSHGSHTHPERHSRGENHYAAKLSDADIDKIKRMYQAGVSQAEISRMFEVSPSHISNIVRNKKRAGAMRKPGWEKK